MQAQLNERLKRFSVLNYFDGSHVNLSQALNKIVSRSRELIRLLFSCRIFSIISRFVRWHSHEHPSVRLLHSSSRRRYYISESCFRRASVLLISCQLLHAINLAFLVRTKPIKISIGRTTMMNGSNSKIPKRSRPKHRRNQLMWRRAKVTNLRWRRLLSNLWFVHLGSRPTTGAHQTRQKVRLLQTARGPIILLLLLLLLWLACGRSFLRWTCE